MVNWIFIITIIIILIVSAGVIFFLVVLGFKIKLWLLKKKIPKDIKDCFITLDAMLSKADIDSIKALPNREATIRYHLGFGMWLRNNWGLWGGSRLQNYFLQRNIKHPDSMSGLILVYYYDWLNGKNEEWIKFDKK